MEMQTGTTTNELLDNTWYLLKLNTCLPYDPVIPGYISQNSAYLCWWKEMNLGVCNSTELGTTQRSINRKADEHILVYLYCSAAMRGKNVSLHRVIRKALTNIMLTDRSQEKRAQAICCYLYKAQRQAKGISAIRGQAVGDPQGEKLCLERVFGEEGFWGRG